MNRALKCAGFSLIELLTASAIMALAVGISVGGFIHMLKSIKFDDVQNELDIEVQLAMERTKYDLRLSALDKMFFYPAGPGPFTAVSFPMARDDDGDGAVEKAEDETIIWDRTIVYHVWRTEPHQLRRTVFDPRDNTLTDAQRQEQIDSVVVNGHGGATHNAANATTETVFENLFQWTITPQGAVYDGYATEVQRQANVSLGSCLLGSGTHAFKFTVIGRNGSSTGSRIGIDSLCASPSYSRREAEDLLPSIDQLGALADREYMAGGSWNGNYRLMFPAVANGNYFTLVIENDLWRETNFSTSGDSHENTRVCFDTSLNPHNFVVGLEGMGTNWSAELQTGNDLGASSPPGLAKSSAVRVLIRGEEMVGGNWLSHSGEKCKVAFRAAGGQPLRLVAAYLGEASSADSNTMDVATGSQRPLTFGGSAGVSVPAGGQAWSDLVDVPIRQEKSYLVTFLVSGDLPGGAPWQWNDLANPTLATSFMVPAANAAQQAAAAAETWSAYTNVAGFNAVLGVSRLFSTYPVSGTYVSAVFDTHCDAPIYSLINWDASVPDGADIQLKVRTGDESDLSDAPAWTNVTFIPIYGMIEPGNGRYCQFLARLSSDPTRQQSPRLKNFTMKWHGPERMVDVAGTFAKGPDHGIFEVTVDGQEILTAVNVDLEIFNDVRGYRGDRRLTSRLCAEIEPRNTGL